MAKRRRSLSSITTKNKRHPRKTKKRLAIKVAMLAAKVAKHKRKTRKIK